MSDHLNKPTVLVLNCVWQAINVRTPQQAFCQMVTDVATALDISGESMIPVKWADWCKLPVREDDDAVSTPHGMIRIPTVIVLANYDSVPKCKPKFSSHGIWERDGGICQYTGKVLKRGEGNIDHVIPRKLGGKSTWRNCVLADKSVNSRKGHKLPHEAGLRLIRKPVEPKAVPAIARLGNPLGIRDWDHFLLRKN